MASSSTHSCSPKMLALLLGLTVFMLALQGTEQASESTCCCCCPAQWCGGETNAHGHLKEMVQTTKGIMTAIVERLSKLGRRGNRPKAGELAKVAKEHDPRNQLSQADLEEVTACSMRAFEQCKDKDVAEMEDCCE